MLGFVVFTLVDSVVGLGSIKLGWLWICFYVVLFVFGWFVIACWCSV